VGTVSNLGSEWIRIVNTMHTRLLQIAEANEKWEKREEVRMAGSWSDWSEAHSASRWDQYIQGCLGKEVFGWLRGVRQHGRIARIRAVRSLEGRLHVLLPRRARKRGEGGPPHSWAKSSSYMSRAVGDLEKVQGGLLRI